jgi:hypothetical protein
MAEIIYQVTKFGEGFHGPGRTSLDLALPILKNKLDRTVGPYQFRGEKKTFTQAEMIAEAKKRALKLRVGQKLVILGSDTGQPSFALRMWEREETESPLVTFSKQFVGKSPYRLGAPGPPNDSDCSGLTMNAVKNVYKVSLQHKADLQMRDPRVVTFRDESRLRSGDFVFLNYGRLPAGEADHVEFFVKPGRTLGSRGSTNGVGYYNFGDDDASRVLRFGRLRKDLTDR